MTKQPYVHPYDVLIIGSGPAGWTAAVYATRANLSTLLITGQLAGGVPGGQLMLTSDVENYPGFADGILGPELMDQMGRQAVRFGTDVVEEDVTRVDFSRPPFTVFTGEGDGERAYHAKTVILATGASAQWLGLPSEERMRGRGVSACATCDGFFFRDQEVAVIGGGDTAMEEALFLTRFASKVTIVHRREALRASKILQDRARSNPKIAWALSRETVEILGDDRVDGVKLRDTRSGVEEVVPVQGVFVAIGHRPNTTPFRGQVELDEHGYILARRHTATTVPGVFVAGDANDHRYRQAVTAAGEGAKAALDAEEFLTGALSPNWSSDEADTGGKNAEPMSPSIRGGDPATSEGEANTNENGADQPHIVIYTTTWCPDCRRAKRYLDQRGLKYLEIDIEKVPGAAEQVEQWSGGFRTVPTFNINGRVIVDFDRTILDEVLITKTNEEHAVPVEASR